jgi:hypothetical protein
MESNGTKKILDLGFVDQKNCLVDTNCSINMRGKRSYYLSGVQFVQIYLINRAVDLDLEINL